MKRGKKNYGQAQSTSIPCLCSLTIAQGAHTLFIGQTERKREGERESKRVRERERERERERKRERIRIDGCLGTF